MVSHKKLYVAAVLLVVAAVVSQPPPPVAQHVSDAPVYQGVDLEDTPADRQAGVAVALGTLLLPIVTSLVSSLTSNIGTSITNAFSATMAGARLELIPIEAMMDAKTMTRERPPLQAVQRRRRVSTTTDPKEDELRQ